MTEKQIKTLTDEEMTTERHVGRRSVLALVAGGIATGAALAVGMRAGVAQAQGKATAIRGCSDNDSGSNEDPAGNGRGNGRSDNDSGSNEDPAGCGR